MTYEFKFLIIGVIRVGVIGMLAFLNKRHLIESYRVLRESMPKKMVKCVDSGELRNIRKTESRKFDILVLKIKQITIYNNIVLLYNTCKRCKTKLILCDYSYV